MTIRDKLSSPHRKPARLLSVPDQAVRAALADSYGRLRKYLQKRLRGKPEAEEVLQAFAVRALERSADIRDADSVRGWLSRVLETTVADFYRQRLRQEKREAPFVAEPSDRASLDQADSSDKAACECLYALLPLLKAAHAELIRRIDLENEARETVAAEIGITTNNLTVRLHRARLALRRRLEAMCMSCLQDSFLDCSCDTMQLEPIR